MSLFNSIPTFSIENLKFTCVECKFFVEKLENYQDDLGDDQYFSSKVIPDTKDM